MARHEHTKKAVKHLKTGVEIYKSYQQMQQDQQPTRRSFDDDEDVFVLRDLDDHEEFFGREFEYDLFDERDIIDDLD